MIRTLVAAAVAACIAGPALADADAAIKYRQNAMKAIGSQMGSIVAILKGEIDNKAALGEHAALIGAATNITITKPAFMTNTDGKGDLKTTAIGAVWTLKKPVTPPPPRAPTSVWTRSRPWGPPAKPVTTTSAKRSKRHER